MEFVVQADFIRNPYWRGYMMVLTVLELCLTKSRLFDRIEFVCRIWIWTSLLFDTCSWFNWLIFVDLLNSWCISGHFFRGPLGSIWGFRLLGGFRPSGAYTCVGLSSFCGPPGSIWGLRLFGKFRPFGSYAGVGFSSCL